MAAIVPVGVDHELEDKKADKLQGLVESQDYPQFEQLLDSSGQIDDEQCEDQSLRYAIHERLR